MEILETIRMKKISWWSVARIGGGTAIVISACVFAAPVLADNGILCGQAGGSCALTNDCINSHGTNLPQNDCQSAGSDYVCCGAGQAPNQSNAPLPTAGTTAPTTAPASTALGVLALPACIKSGNCTLDDIVTTGANFANLLTQLSAALFFATFVYGGAMYLLSFGDKSRVEKGKKAIVGAAIGMAIVLGAWTMVTYVANSLLGRKM
ncbi:MAG: pilin [Patescibacteria group bacterium]